MAKDDEFSLPDIDFLFTHEVEDKEHPVYKQYGSEDYNNTEYEEDEDEKDNDVDSTSTATRPSKPRKATNGTNTGNGDKRRATRRTGGKNAESQPSRPKRKRKKHPAGSDNSSHNKKKRKTHVDKRTGLEYEFLPGSDKEAIKAFKSTKGEGLGINEMFKYTDLADNFDGFDLIGDAKRFLPHMRVPISEEERQEALEKLARAKRRRLLEEEGKEM